MGWVLPPRLLPAPPRFFRRHTSPVSSPCTLTLLAGVIADRCGHSSGLPAAGGHSPGAGGAIRRHLCSRQGVTSVCLSVHVYCTACVRLLPSLARLQRCRCRSHVALFSYPSYPACCMLLAACKRCYPVSHAAVKVRPACVRVRSPLAWPQCCCPCTAPQCCCRQLLVAACCAGMWHAGMWHAGMPRISPCACLAVMQAEQAQRARPCSASGLMWRSYWRLYR